MPNMALPRLHRSPKQLVLLVMVMALAACATKPEINALVGTGTISEIHAAAALPGGHDMGIYRPGMGGAMGGLMVGLLSSIGSERAHNIYVVQLADGSKRWIRSSEPFAVGACVSIRTSQSLVKETSLPLDAAQLLPATSC